jgi:hypothetical protein
MSRQILKSAVSCSFNQFFDLPFTIDDILAEFGCTIDRIAINLPRKTLDRPLDNLRHELKRNRQRIELVNEMARHEALIGPLLFEVAEIANQRINVEYSIIVSEHLRGRLITILRIKISW